MTSTIVFFVDILHSCMYVNAFGVAFLDTFSLGGKRLLI